MDRRARPSSAVSLHYIRYAGIVFFSGYSMRNQASLRWCYSVVFFDIQADRFDDNNDQG